MNTHHIIGYVGISLLLLGSCRMPTPTPGIEEALSKAGSNRNELFQVIKHYPKGTDSLKLKAALFLTENMTDKYYLSGEAINEYYTFIDSVYQIWQKEYDISAIYDEFKGNTILFL